MKTALRLFRYAGIGFLVLLGAVWLLWAFGAVWHFNFLGSARFALAVLVAAAGLVLPFLRPRRIFLAADLGMLLLVTLVFIAIPASHNRDWVPEYGRLPRCEFQEDGRFRVHDIRDFRYRSETSFDIRYRTDDFDLKQLESLDFVVVHWDNMEGIAHTMLSFGFRGGQQLVFSVETRRDRGDVYGAIPGIYKQFELIYLIGTEADLLGLRTNYRHEQVYLYPTNATTEEMRVILLDLLEKANGIYRQPQFYNSLTSNCTTSLLPSIRRAVALPFRDPSFLCNGFTDRLAFRLGWLRTRQGESFPELKFRRYANPKVDKAPIGDDYSRRIRRDTLLPTALEMFGGVLLNALPEPFSMEGIYDETGEVSGLEYRYFRYSYEDAAGDLTRLTGNAPLEVRPYESLWRSDCYRVEIELTAKHRQRPRLRVLPFGKGKIDKLAEP